MVAILINSSDQIALQFLREESERLGAKNFSLYHLYYSASKKDGVECNRVCPFLDRSKEIDDVSYVERIGESHKYMAYEIIGDYEKKQAMGCAQFQIGKVTTAICQYFKESPNISSDRDSRVNLFWKVDAFRAQRVPILAKFKDSVICSRSRMSPEDTSKAMAPAEYPRTKVVDHRRSLDA